MKKILYGWHIGKLDFEVYEDGSVIAFKIHKRWKKLATWSKLFLRLYSRKIDNVNVSDLSEFVLDYKQEILRHDIVPPIYELEGC